MRDEKPGILELLIEHELAIKELYASFAALFSAQAGFWQELAEQEQGHADRLEEVRIDAQARQWVPYDFSIRAEAIRMSNGFVREQIALAEKGNFTPLQALSLARDLENALLEKQLTKLKSSAPREIRPVLAILANETDRHRRNIEAMFAAEKQKES